MPVYKCSFPLEAAGLTVTVRDGSGSTVTSGALSSEPDENAALVYHFTADEAIYVGSVSSSGLGTLETHAVLDVIDSIEAGGGGDVESLVLPFATAGVAAAYSIASVPYSEYVNIPWDYTDELGPWLEVVPDSDGHELRITEPGLYEVCAELSVAGGSSDDADFSLGLRIYEEGDDDLDPGYAMTGRRYGILRSLAGKSYSQKLTCRRVVPVQAEAHIIVPVSKGTDVAVTLESLELQCNKFM